MTIDEEQRYYLGLTDSVFKTVEDAYENIFNCEDSIESLLEIAATIFSYPEFLMLLNDYEKLQSYAAEFENIVAKLNRPLTVLDSTTVIALDKVIDKINVLFILLADWMDKANTRIEAKQFDMNKVMLLERIENLTKLEWETVDWKELDSVMDKTFLVVRIKDYLDKDFNQDIYMTLNVLSLKGFNTRAEANRYALANGISRDNVITRL